MKILNPNGFTGKYRNRSDRQRFKSDQSCGCTRWFPRTGWCTICGEHLKSEKIFIIQDKTAYGTGLADAFKKAAEDLGAKIVGYEGITVGEKDFNGVLNQVADKKPDMIYFGGLYAEGGLIVKQAHDKGIDIPFMGGDGLDSSSFVEIAGEAVKNAYLTSIAGDVTKSAEGKKFSEEYKTQFNKNIEGYSAYAYDSAGVIYKQSKMRLTKWREAANACTG